MTKPIIGVLALQGCVERHKPHIEAAGGIFQTVKTQEDCKKVDAFILPGGESTTMLKLIKAFDLEEVFMRQFQEKPVWGICAGSILMAREVKNPAQKSFALIDMTVERNGYGTQLDSIQDTVEGYQVSFIRAPIIDVVHDSAVKIKAEREGKPTWIQTPRYMATTFHPELTLEFPSPMHQTFLDMV